MDHEFTMKSIDGFELINTSEIGIEIAGRYIDSEDEILSAIIKNDFSCCPEAAKIFNQKTINGTLKFGGF